MSSNNTNDKFARLRAIAGGNNGGSDDNVRYWNFERDGNLLGIINSFHSFEHPQYGEQHVVTVKLADTGESASAFLNGWLQEGMKRKQAEVGDAVLIRFFGKQSGERFNRYQLEIEKANPGYPSGFEAMNF
ncbi:hypothetical protein [Methylomonas fluvii]|uniref:Uncharacterized protein n=1 Tax=Methylomonas fluvii TaxID=1854564 RepID=A0ABR9DF99_9GAMM|nr:hypothetical protein [Methylomonas fluvii]MBD9361760.1 hypothetical protein [Methylomonas fluvii]CAD6874768.1 hypothetical protein [Methylomonas fluvii]